MADLFYSYEGDFFGFTSNQEVVPQDCHLTGKAYTRKTLSGSISDFTYSLEE
jgi:hypothetical protein